MRNVWTIAKREYNHYFTTPIAYVVAFMIFLVLGIIFIAILRQSIDNALQQFASVPDISPLTADLVFLFIFSIPALTMRLISDETRMGTMELLLTAPVRDWELIVGKWLGGFLFILTILAITLIYPLILNGLVKPGIDQGLMMTAYLGAILVGASFLALGVGISAIFSNQIAAFFLSMGLFIFLWWLVGIPAQILPTGTTIFQYLDMQGHFNTLNQGSIALADIVYFLSLIALGLFTGTATVEMRRWR